LRAVFYHEGKESWSAELRGDSSPWAKVTARPNVPETVWVRIPQQAYRKDARIEFSLRRISGASVSLAGLKLFQTESRDKGYELAVFGGRAPSVRSFRARPSLFTERTSLHYTLAVPGRVTVDIFDAAGRLVRGLVEEAQVAGLYDIPWDGRDDRGRRLPAGIYFCRLDTDGAARSTRVVIVE
jgi:hypothetical protein